MSSSGVGCVGTSIVGVAIKKRVLRTRIIGKSLAIGRIYFDLPAFSHEG